MSTPAEEIGNELLTLEAQLTNITKKISAMRQQIMPEEGAQKKRTKRQQTDEYIKRMIDRHRDKLVKKYIKINENKKPL
jgi:hypothetical protein